jgi:16S rRNA (uracil1498-N3)-methyltransferase
MIRLFLPPENFTTQQIRITGDQARHLCLVLRVQSGDVLTIFDGLGYRYTCKTLKINKKEVIAEQVKKEPYSAESPVSITLAQGIPKGDKMDLIVQKSTELGVTKIIPLFTDRSQVRHTEKADRWRKIALSAAQQSGREKIPEISEPYDFNTFLLSLQAGCVGPTEQFHAGIIFFEGHKESNLGEILTEFKNKKELSLLVGPEGGFSEDEVYSAVEKGFMEASLGPRILRTETAPITAISIIQYELGDMG